MREEGRGAQGHDRTLGAQEEQSEVREGGEGDRAVAGAGAMGPEASLTVSFSARAPVAPRTPHVEDKRRDLFVLCNER